MEKQEYLCKVLVIGSKYVGKSSIIYRYVHEYLPSDGKVMFNIEFVTKKEKVDGKEVLLQIWDCSLRDHYIKGIVQLA